MSARDNEEREAPRNRSQQTIDLHDHDNYTTWWAMCAWCMQTMGIALATWTGPFSIWADPIAICTDLRASRTYLFMI